MSGLRKRFRKWLGVSDTGTSTPPKLDDVATPSGDGRWAEVPPGDLERAAMLNLWPLPNASQWFPVSDLELDRAQAWVDEKRVWTKSIDDSRVRSAYLGWINYVQKGINENRQENQTHAERDRSREFWERHRSEQAVASTVADVIPKPPKGNHRG